MKRILLLSIPWSLFVAAAVLFGVAKTDLEKLKNMLGGAGSGSPVRVVGGSLTPATRSHTWSVDTRTLLQTPIVDTTVLQLVNVIDPYGAGPETVNYPAGILSKHWSVTEIVRDKIDTNRGIVASPLNSGISGQVKFSLLNEGKDYFDNDPSDSTKRRYRNADKDSHCPATPKGVTPQLTPEECERVDKILVYTGSDTDTYYCKAPDGTCDVNIGSEIKTVTVLRKK